MKKSFQLTILILMSGCLDYPTDWDIELWEQKIENSNLSVYKFDAWGGRDSNASGLKIIESSKGFTQKDVLKEDGTFIAKVRQGGTQNELLAEMKKDFKVIKHIKPPASRKESSETYLIAQGFRG